MGHGMYVQVLKGGENWSALMSWESKPDVISTPIQQMKSQRYRYRRFGFLYHGVLSPATMVAMRGSAPCPLLRTAIVDARDVASAVLLEVYEDRVYQIILQE